MASRGKKWLLKIPLAAGVSGRSNRLRGEKSADNTGAGSRCIEYAGVEDMAEIPAFMEIQSVCM